MDPQDAPYKRGARRPGITEEKNREKRTDCDENRQELKICGYN